MIFTCGGIRLKVSDSGYLVYWYESDSGNLRGWCRFAGLTGGLSSGNSSE